MRRTVAVIMSAVFAAALAGAIAVAAGPKKPRRVSIATKDGKFLAALYRKPDAGKPVAVMLHGLSSTKEEWSSFSESLAAAGWGTLAYDARAHGANDPDRLGVRQLGNPGPGSQWERMVDDLGAAMRYLEGQDVARSSVAVIGASLGANVAARYASLSSPFRALVLLSPGLNYMEFNPEADVMRIGSPTVIVASVDDAYAYQSSLRLKNLAPAHELWTDVPPGHGVQMLTPEFSDRLIRWLSGADR